MRTTILCYSAILILLIAGLSTNSALAVATVGFVTESLPMTEGNTFYTPAIEMRHATGTTNVNLSIHIPSDINISTATSSGNLVCVQQGSGINGLFYSEWNSATRTISISCTFTTTGTVEIVKCIQFAVPATSKSCQMTLVSNHPVGSEATLFGNLSLVIQRSIQVSTSPSFSVSIPFSPNPDHFSLASPGTTPFTLSYPDTTNIVSLIAPKQNGANHPMWFDYWVLDGASQSQNTVNLQILINAKDHVASAVYSKYVGDLNSDGHVDKLDANLILIALLGETQTTEEMDVDLSGIVDLKDARWILSNRF